MIGFLCDFESMTGFVDKKSLKQNGNHLTFIKRVPIFFDKKKNKTFCFTNDVKDKLFSIFKRVFFIQKDLCLLRLVDSCPKEEKSDCSFLFEWKILVSKMKIQTPIQTDGDKDLCTGISSDQGDVVLVLLFVLRLTRRPNNRDIVDSWHSKDESIEEGGDRKGVVSLETFDDV